MSSNRTRNAPAPGEKVENVVKQRALLLAAILMMASPAWSVQEAYAQGREASSEDDAERTRRVEELSNQARARYKAKDFEGAIALYEQAYELEQVANLRFNIARCYEKLEEWEAAIENYEAFVTAPEVESSARKGAMDRIKKIQEIIDIEDPASSGEPAKPKDPTPPQEPEPKGKSKAPAFAVIGAGALLVGGGATFGVLARNQQTTFEQATTTEAKQLAQKTGKRNALIADGMYVLGAAAITTGVIMLARGGQEEAAARSGGEETASLWSGWLTRGSAGVQVHVTF